MKPLLHEAAPSHPRYPPPASVSLQVLYAYYTGVSLEEALTTDFPNNHVMQIAPAPTKLMWDSKLIPLDPNAGSGLSSALDLAHIGLHVPRA